MLKHRLILIVDKYQAIVLGCELMCVSMRRLLTRHGWSSMLRSHFMGGTELISSFEFKNGEGVLSVEFQIGLLETTWDQLST